MRWCRCLCINSFSSELTKFQITRPGDTNRDEQTRDRSSQPRSRSISAEDDISQTKIFSTYGTEAGVDV